MAVMFHQTQRIVVDDLSAVPAARRDARNLAQSLGFSPSRVEQIAICASELATNLDKHTRGGEIYLQPVPATAAPELEMLSVDGGPGVEPFERCLVDGYSTTRTLGAGLGAVRRMANMFTTYSRAEQGSVVYARFGPYPGRPAQRTHIEVGALCLPAYGHEVSGDAYRISDDGTDVTVLIVDGLGHGTEAARASHRAIEPSYGPTDVDPAAVLKTVHDRLLATRGAAAAAVRIEVRHGRALFCGVGNISGAVLASAVTSPQRLGSRPGTLGLKMPTPNSQAVALPAHGTLVLHTDGIRARWDLARYPGLLAQPAPVLAAVLVRDFWRHRDDAAIAVLRTRPVLGGDRIGAPSA